LHALGVIVLAYLIAQRLAPRAAWIAPVVLMATFPFVEASHYIRPDVVATFYGLFAVWLYLLGRDGRPSYLVAAGASAGFAAGLFYEAIWAFVVLGIWALADLRRLRTKVAWLVGGAVAALIPLLVFVLHDLDNYRRFTRKFGGSSIFGGPQGHDALPVAVWHSLLHEPDRYLAVERWSQSKVYILAVVALAVLALAGALARRSFRVASLLLVPLAVIAAAGANKTTIYFVVAAPALGILAAAFAARSRATLTVTVALTIALVGAYSANVAHALDPVRTDYHGVEKAFRTAFRFPGGSLVIGIPLVYAYYLHDGNVEFRSIHFFTSFDDFRVEPTSQLVARLDAASERGHVYLVYDPATFDSEMRQIDPDQSHVRRLRRLIDRRFEPVATVHVRGSSSGDYDTTIAEYEAQSSGRRR
jgi:4-amino-4-deoxy-L-arabinose transferase-like glycosyltransferase